MRSLEAGHEVVVVDNLHTGQRSNVPAAATFYDADITDEDHMDAIFGPTESRAMSHQAALANVRESMNDPIDYARVNVLGTLTLLELARRHGCRTLRLCQHRRRRLRRGTQPRRRSAALH